MKKLLSTLVAIILASSTLSAEEKVIQQSNLPKSAQTFLTTHYSGDKVSITTMERDLLGKDYKVILTSGTKIEFDSSGNWTEIECKGNNSVPSAVIPSKIADCVNEKFPNISVTKIERDKKKVEVELKNDIELKFNSKGELIEIES